MWLPGAKQSPGSGLALGHGLPLRGLRLLSGVRRTPFHCGQWEGNRIHRPRLLHISVFAIFAEADVVFIRGCCGAHMGSAASGLHCGGLVGQPGAGEGGAESEEVQHLLPPPSPAAHPPLPGGVVLFRSTAAVGAEANTTQDRQQGGAPAHIERRAQLIPGGKTTQGSASSGTCPSSTPRVGLPHSLGSGIQGVKEVMGDVGGVPGDGHHPAAT